MLPPVINIGPIPIHLYGLCIGLGIFAAGTITSRVAKNLIIRNSPASLARLASKRTDGQLAISPAAVWDSLFYAVLGGIIGARLYHVIDFWAYYSQNLILIPQIWTGGLGIYGAIAGGILVLYFYTRKHNIKLSELLDIAAFGIPVGQAIGRLGNFINQELYGLPTNSAWGLPIDLSHRLPGFESYTHFHPLFAYEAILSLISAGIIWGLYRAKHWPIGQGKYFALYILNYAIIRTILESLRINPWTIFGLPTAQIIGVLIIFFVGRFLLLRKS